MVSEKIQPGRKGFFSGLFLHVLACFFLMFSIPSNALSTTNGYTLRNLIHILEYKTGYKEFKLDRFISPSCLLQVNFKNSFKGIEITKRNYMFSIKFKKKGEGEWNTIDLEESLNPKIIRFKKREYFEDINNKPQEELNKVMKKIYKEKELHILESSNTEKILEGDSVIFLGILEDGVKQDSSGRQNQYWKGEEIITLNTNHFKILMRDKDGGISQSYVKAKPGDQFRFDVYRMTALNSLSNFFPVIKTEENFILTVKEFGLKPNYSFQSMFTSKITQWKITRGIFIVPPFNGFCVNLFLDYKRPVPEEKLVHKIFGSFLFREIIGIHFGFSDTVWKGGSSFGVGLAISTRWTRKYFSIVIGFDGNGAFSGFTFNPTAIESIIKAIGNLKE